MPSIAIPSAELEEICRRFGVQSLAVFGSVARGDARPDSDIDLLVEFQPGRHPGLGYMKLERELAELFGRPVDLASKRWFRERVSSRILSEAQTLYAA
ncbi:MAG: nucleotidyltransferase family protein [Acidobacteria bacterium]|nr:nucleotidyltransferase family protein [Acidobacteriota bacterium]